jgi:Protein of unknown function (DUF2878)
MKLPWSKILNAVGYQAVWFVTLFSASKGNFWLGFFSSMVFSILMLCFGGKAKLDVRIVIIGLILGVSIDSAFAASGWIQYAMPWPAISMAPLWIIALWLSFSFTLNHSMSFLRQNYIAGAAFGFIGGPLAYWCADRVFDVIAYGTDMWLVMLGLGLCWGLVVPLIFYIDARLSLAQDKSGKAVA